jgi:hypothetical protein
VGLNVTLTLHESCAASVAPHVLVCAKSPVVSIPLKVTALPPSLVICRFLARLAMPTLCALNFNFAGETDNAPGVAVAVGVADALGVAVTVGVGVTPRVAVAVAVGVALLAGVRTVVAEAVGDGVALGVAVGVAHAAGVADAESPIRKMCAWYA